MAIGASSLPPRNDIKEEMLLLVMFKYFSDHGKNMEKTLDKGIVF